MNELETYLDFLYETDVGHVYVPTRPNGTWESTWFEWPRQKLELTDFIRTQGRVADVHIGTALYKRRGGLKDDVLSSRVVWCEFDGNFSGEWKGIPEPDLMIQSSGVQNVHCYWKVETLTEIKAIEEITYRLAYHLEADEGCWNANRVLRPPETNNFKRGEPTPVSIIKLDSETRHFTKDFDKAERVANHPKTFITADVIEWNLLRSKVPVEITRRVEKFKVKEGDRSTFYYKVAADLARHNFSELEIFSTLFVLDERIRKFADRNDRLERLASLAAKVVLPIISSRKIEAYTINELLALQEPDIHWILQDVLPVGETGILFGQPGVGKTQMATWMGRLLAAGKPVFNETGLEPIRVLFFSKEIHRALLRIFLSKQDVDLHGLGGDNFILAFPDISHSLQSIQDLLLEYKPHLFIIDSLVQMVPSLKEEELLKQAVDSILAISGESAVIFVHHTTKAAYDSKEGPTLKDSYGGMYPLTVASSVMSLHGVDNDLTVKLLKNRFGPLTEFKVKRSSNLTFEVSKHASGRSTESEDNAGKSPKFGLS